MGLFDTIYAELDCPFCDRQFRYTPMTWDAARDEIEKRKQLEFEDRARFLQGNSKFYFQELWSIQDGFEDVDAWIAQLDSEENIEAHRTRRELGLASMQTKAFESLMQDYFVGGEVPSYPGHYFIPTSFVCPDCSTPDETVFVDAWVEIKDHKIVSVTVHNPETGETGREIIPGKHIWE